MPYVDAFGARLYVEERGSGYPIIFVHEFASDLRGWDSQVRHFAGGYRCVAYNARGYPPSASPEDPELYGWEFAVDDIAAVMRGLKLERVHLVGLGLGAYAALQFGLRYPEKVSAIVAASVGSDFQPSEGNGWWPESSLLARIFIKHGMASLAGRMARGVARMKLKHKGRKSWQELLGRLPQHSGQQPSMHDLRDPAEITTPVLLAVGDEDMRCLNINLTLKFALPNAGLWICPRTGHAINLEQPAAFNAQVQAFLSAAERGRWRQSDANAGRRLWWFSRRETSPGDVNPEDARADVVRLHPK